MSQQVEVMFIHEPGGTKFREELEAAYMKGWSVSHHAVTCTSYATTIYTAILERPFLSEPWSPV